MNYLFGLTRVGLGPYTAGTALGLVPPVTLFVTLGALGRVALADLQHGWGKAAAALAGLVILAIAIVIIIRRVAAMTPLAASGRSAGPAN